MLMCRVYPAARHDLLNASVLRHQRSGVVLVDNSPCCHLLLGRKRILTNTIRCNIFTCAQKLTIWPA